MNALTEKIEHEASAGKRRRGWRQLASRSTGGISVGLYWSPDGDEVFVHVSDEQTGERFVLEPPRDAALTAFYHPYALRQLEGAE
jgi:hypothetical protein